MKNGAGSETPSFTSIRWTSADSRAAQTKRGSRVYLQFILCEQQGLAQCRHHVIYLFAGDDQGWRYDTDIDQWPHQQSELVAVIIHEFADGVVLCQQCLASGVVVQSHLHGGHQPRAANVPHQRQVQQGAHLLLEIGRGLPNMVQQPLSLDDVPARQCRCAGHRAG